MVAHIKPLSKLCMIGPYFNTEADGKFKKLCMSITYLGLICKSAYLYIGSYKKYSQNSDSAIN